jgi:hypothetical protein
MLEGAIVAPSPSDREKLMELLVVKMPHRAARTLVAAREQGTLPVAALRDRRDVRALLDQVHLQDPMFLGAFAELLKNHLIDLAVLFAEINADDLNVLNELTKGTASSDPFFMGRHSAGSAIRQQLIDDKILNPLDQHKHSDVKNPYTTLMRLRFNQGELLMRIDGIEQTTSVTAFRETLIKIRRRLYRGIDVLDMDSRVPWAVDDVAYHLRFVRQQITDNPGRDVLEVLYMLERAVSYPKACLRRPRRVIKSPQSVKRGNSRGRVRSRRPVKRR